MGWGGLLLRGLVHGNIGKDLKETNKGYPIPGTRDMSARTASTRPDPLERMSDMFLQEISIVFRGP